MNKSKKLTSRSYVHFETIMSDIDNDSKLRDEELKIIYAVACKIALNYRDYLTYLFV